MRPETIALWQSDWQLFLQCLVNPWFYARLAILIILCWQIKIMVSDKNAY